MRVEPGGRDTSGQWRDEEAWTARTERGDRGFERDSKENVLAEEQRDVIDELLSRSKSC